MFKIDPSHPMPLYAQLEQSIRLAIATGRMHLGEQLPTVRQLAVDLRINANTVAKVYAGLENAGVVETRRGVGTFVRAHETEAMRPGDRERELRALVDRLLSEAAAIGCSPDIVLEHLKSRLKKER